MPLKTLLLFLFSILSSTAWAQTPCFKAYDAQDREITTLCVGQEVTFQDCGNTIPDENEYYVFDYKSGTPIPTPSSPVKSHTYDTPGRYRVLQIANYGGNRLTDTVSVVFDVKETPAPVFSAFSCSNRAVSVLVSDNQYDSYLIDYGNGRTQQVNPGQQESYNYSTAGPYTITVSGVYEGSSCTGSSTVQLEEIAPYTAPSITHLQVEAQSSTNGTVSISFVNLLEGYEYVLEQKSSTATTFTEIAVLNNSQPGITLADLNTSEPAQYRISAKDKCGKVLPSSNIIASVVLEATVGDEQVSLTWQSIAGQQNRYELYRNGTLNRNFTSSTSSFIDFDVNCGEEYCYQLRTFSLNGEVTSTTAEVCEIATSTTKPEQAQLVSSFNLNNQIELMVELPGGQVLNNVRFERSLDGAAYQLLSTESQPQYTDSSTNLQEVCYRAQFTNACGNPSDFSNVSCPVLLKASLPDDASVSLEWTIYQGFTNGVGQYTLEVLDQNYQIIASYPVNGTSYTDNSLPDAPFFQYRIKVTSGTSSFTTYSNIIPVQQPLKLYVPSAFTPNNDGLNDVLEVKGKFFTNYSITIYNRLGNVVYKSTDITNGWDGTYKGTPVPADVYTYAITVTNAEGELKHRTGTLTILR